MAKLDNPYDLPESFPQEVRDAYRTLWEIHEAGFTIGDWKEQFDRESAAFDVIRDHANNLPEGELVGVILTFGVADGSANYLVVNRKPLTVAYLPVVDNYTVQDALIRGLNLTDVKQHARRNKALAEIFGSKKAGRVD